MGFRLQAGEPAGAAVRRIAGELVAGTVALLDGAGEGGPDGRDNRDLAVHEARKACKRLRAVLRLARPQPDGGLYRRENAAVRDAARILSATRDRAVLASTFAGLVASADDPDAYAGLRALLPRGGDAGERDGADGDALARAAAQLRAVGDRVSDWPLTRDGWAAFDEGLAAIYRRGQKAMAAALTSHADDDLHTWRKSTKYLWHAVEVLTPVWEPVLEPLADQLHTLSSALGDDHDLALLDAWLAGRTDAPAARAQLHDLLQSRRATLQAQAEALGRRVWAEPPAAFTDRIGCWYAAWCDEQGPV